MTRWLAGSLVALAACATMDAAPPDDGTYDADPGDFDSKADNGFSGSSAAVLSFIDGTTTRLYAKVSSLADKPLVQHLTAAAKRGVDVHIYVVVPSPAHPKTVLAAEGLEASGVDTFTERTDHLAGFVAIGDNKLLSSTGKTTTRGVSTAAKKFLAAIAEDTSETADPITGTQLLVMPDSHAGAIVSLIGGAKTSIDLEIYQLQSPAVIAALEAAAARGVAVRVMLEPKTVGAINYGPVSAQLAKAKISVQATPPAFDSHRNVDHAKFMVIDSAELVFGSGNLVRSGLGGNPAGEFDNRDFWVRDHRAASVAEARQLFDADWSRNATTSLAFDSLVLTPDNANARVLALIDGAKDRLFVYNQSLDDAELVQHLIAANGRGADVHVLLGMQPGFGGPPPNQPAIDQLTAAGIDAGFFTTHYLHGKVVVADSKAFVGSQNFTNGGLGKNRELGEILDDADLVDELASTFTADLAKPAP